MGHYKHLFERNTGVSYWKHWSDPAGTSVRLGGLRNVAREQEVRSSFDPDERLIVAGEQTRKRRTTDAEDVRTWGDFFDGRKIRFATFAPPGRYDVNKP